MSSADGATDRELQRFFDGQRLFAADLQFLVDALRGSNERHNRLLHGPGIAKGFAVEAAPGDREITIGPGYALDAAGHEIVLAAAHAEQVPAVDVGEDGGPVFYDLTVSHPADEDLDVAETRFGLCDTHGVVRLAVEPLFCWVRLGRMPDGTLQAVDAKLRADVQENLKIRIARLEILHCALQSLSTAERRSARPPTRPYVRCGRERPGWTHETFPAGDEPMALFLLADVDTSSGGFLTTPCYSARIAGDRILTGTLGDESTTFVADGVVSIEQPTEIQFRLRVLVHATANLFTASPSPAAPFASWEVEWMGVE